MTEEKYNFYKNSTKQNGSGNVANNVNGDTNTANNQPEENKPTENKPVEANSKINFKFSALGNLDQTLKKDAKINIDKLLLRAIFGME
jgi:hypothetical protein